MEHEDALPETGFSSLRGTGEKRGPCPSGHPRKVTSKRFREGATSLGRPNVGGVGPCPVASAGTAEQAALPELGPSRQWKEAGAGRRGSPSPGVLAGRQAELLTPLLLLTLCSCALILSTLPGKSGAAAQDPRMSCFQIHLPARPDEKHPTPSTLRTLRKWLWERPGS